MTDEFKRKQYTEMLSETDDETLLNEVLENEILDSREKTAAKLSLLKPPRKKSSDTIIHYDLKHLPTLHNGYLVQVNFFFCSLFSSNLIRISSSFINIWNIV